jgi:ketosteroid isomerase-like protein
MSQDTVQAVSRLYEAFNRGDLQAFEEGLSKDVVWNEAESSLNCAGNPYRSFAEVRDGVFAPTLRDFRAFQVDLEQLIDAGDYVIGTGRYRGTSTVTGDELSAQFCHVLHLDANGKLDRLQEYVDTLHEAEVTGRTQQVEEIQIIQPAL